MADEKLTAVTSFDGVADNLADGIQSCRSVIANYKALLSSDRSEIASAENEDLPDPSARISAKSE